jgi:RNA-splicing ligase RtcB
VKAVEAYDAVTAQRFGLTGGQVCVMIHCGSRGLGHQICGDYVRIMDKTDLCEVGQPVLIPGSMGTFSHVLAGIAGGGAFCSTCHGAGRVMSCQSTCSADEVS